MFFRARSGGEEQGVDRRIDEAVAKGDAPQAVDRYRLPVGRLELADEPAGGQVIGVDPAVAEVADEQAVAELAKAGGRECHAPGRIERAARRDPPDQMAVRS